MNEHSKELCHWAFGEKKKNHKYIDRIRDTLHDTWKYIYEDKKNATAKNKQAVKNFADNWRDGADAIKSKVKSTFSRSGKASLNSAKEKYKGLIGHETNVKAYTDVEDYFKEQKEKKEKKEREKQQKKEKFVEDTKAFVNRILKKIGIDYQLPTKTKKEQNVSVNFVKNYNDINASAPEVKVGVSRPVNYNQVNVPESVKKAPRKPVAKIKFDDGEMRVLYTKEQVEDWTRIQQYQASEPEFMKDVKGIKPNLNGELPTRMENIEKTNPDYWKDPNATVNCWHCSTAYDLRKRGYDVSALPIDSDFGNSNLDHFYVVNASTKDNVPVGERYNEDAAKFLSSLGAVEINANQTYHDVQAMVIQHEEEYGNPVVKYALDSAENYDGKVMIIGAYKDDHGNTRNVNPINVLSKKIESGEIKQTEVKSILKNDDKFGEVMAEDITQKLDDMPSNSWGRVGINWKESGGHSIVWEKDKSGKVTFIDAQVDEVVDIKDYVATASRGMSVVLQRTDNLELKPEVLEFIRDNNGERNMSLAQVEERFEKENAEIEKLYDDGKIDISEYMRRSEELLDEMNDYADHTVK